MSLRSGWNELVGNVKQRLAVEGNMPERALLRLKRAGISVYNAKKVQKNRILLSVKSKDTEKAFAIFQNVCYNRTGGVPYTVRKIGLLGLGGSLLRFKERTGFWLGALLFCAVSVYADGFVLGVRFTGDAAYAREAYTALEAHGVKPFSRYRGGNEDLIAARLLAIPDLEFCSVKKDGLWAVVEMRLSPFGGQEQAKGDMYAVHTGTVLAVTVLRGTALKRAGESVRAGEKLVGGYLLSPDGKEKAVTPIARVSIACVYEAEITASDKEQAFAIAYLAIGEDTTLTAVNVTATELGFAVRMEYTAVESVNF